MAKDACILKNDGVRLGTDIEHSPENEWQPKIQNMDGGARVNGDGTSSLNVTQTFHDVEIKVKQNLLDGVIVAVQKIIDSITSIPETGGVGAVRGMQSAIQALVFDLDRNLIVNWDYNFEITPTNKKHDLTILHNNVIRASLYKSNRTNIDRMEWETKSQVEFFSKRPKLETFKKDSKIGADVHILNGQGQPDVITGVSGGKQTITLYHRLSLRSVGFAKDLQKLIDDIVEAITEAVDAWSNVEKLVKKKIEEWIDENTKTLKAAWYAFWASDTEVPPTSDEVKAQRDAEEKKLQSDIIRKAKSALKSLLEVIKGLIAEWQGKVELHRAELTISCSSAKEDEEEGGEDSEDADGDDEDGEKGREDDKEKVDPKSEKAVSPKIGQHPAENSEPKQPAKLPNKRRARKKG